MFVWLGRLLAEKLVFEWVLASVLPALAVAFLLLFQGPCRWKGVSRRVWATLLGSVSLAALLLIATIARAIMPDPVDFPEEISTQPPVADATVTPLPWLRFPNPPQQTPSSVPPVLSAVSLIDKIELKWVDEIEDKTGYRVYHSRGNNTVSDGNWQVISPLRLSANTTSWTHKNPPCNVENWYYVVALREAEESVKSNLAHASATCPTPDTPTPPCPCAAALARITLPHAGDVFAPNDDVRVEGAMCREGYSYYEVQYRRVNCQTKQPIGPEDSWATIGEKEGAPVGCSGDVFLAEWSSGDRSQQHVPAGCYQLAIKMRRNGNADLVDESCWVVIELK